MFYLIILLANIFVMTFGSCPNGQIASVSDPTICYSFEKTKMNWFSAMESCTEKGGNLISIHDMFENMFLSGEASSIFTDSATSDFWNGAIYNSISPGKWSWIDKSSFDFTDWENGQPQNTMDSVCASTIMNGAKWQASDCFVEKPFICEMKTSTQKPSLCPDTWTYFNSTNFCYKTFQLNTTWYDAELNCVNQGGHLASVHSFAENLFISYISNQRGNTCDWYAQSWIGLTKNDGSFKWVDGTAFNYSSWVLGSPAYDRPNGNCGITWIGQNCNGNGWDNGPTEWANFECDHSVLNSVCKKVPLEA